MKKRVLIFSIAYEPLLGGAELAVRNITDRLSAYEFDLITARFSRKHAEQERIGNVNVYRVGFGSRLGRYLYPMLAWRLASKLHKGRPYQLVWSIMAAYAGAAALMFLRRFPAVNYLLTLQEGDPIVHIHRRVRGMKKMWQRIFGRADYVQAISRHLAEWARAEGAACPIEIVPNGVAVEKFTPTLSPPHEGERKRGSQFTIITTSRLVPKNGLDILIRALAVILEGAKRLIGSRDIKLQILGSGSEEQKLKKLAHDLNVSDCVEFLGDITPDKVPEYLVRADIFVRPSRSEGLGTAFLEAMAAGLPVIGTAVGGIPDFLQDGATGLFCKVEEPNDLAAKIKLLFEDAPLRRRLGENGKKLVEERYSWDGIAARMNNIFQKLSV
ncbi:MAG: glycosyltransferase family 4 protein [Candidatus Doudnabacteria bacterium]|nr:glycosyltransferase family 4 protein [Candidatus Doudnabacteria bacterium]